jgi:hypothetical protein
VVRVGRQIGGQAFDQAQEIAHTICGMLIESAVRERYIGGKGRADDVGARTSTLPGPAVELIQKARGEANRDLAFHIHTM